MLIQGFEFTHLSAPNLKRFFVSLNIVLDFFEQRIGGIAILEKPEVVLQLIDLLDHLVDLFAHLNAFVGEFARIIMGF